MITADMCEKVYTIAKSNNYDMVMFETYILKDNRISNDVIDSIHLIDSSRELEHKDFYPELLRYMAGTIWRCI